MIFMNGGHIFIRRDRAQMKVFPLVWGTFFLTTPYGDDKIFQCEFRGVYAHFVRFTGLFA